MMKAAALTALITLAACGASDIPDPRTKPHQSNADIDWRDQIIYQIVTDRFENGDPNNDYNVEPSVAARYHGGDWQGIIDKLDYLSELGITALWISPVYKNTEEDAGFASYHGYWPQDFLRANPHFGNVHKLREMVDAAHARGILVIGDVVLNHVGQLFYYDINGNGRPDDWLQGGGTSHTCTQICTVPGREDECSADEKIFCEKGLTYLERITEWDPDYDPRGVQGWTSLGFSGPADVRFLDWPEVNRVIPQRPPEWFGWPDDKAWFDDPSWYNRRGRVYVWWHESDYSTEFVRDQEVHGDFPGGLKDLDTDNPDVQEALIRSYQYWIDVADFDGFRIDTIKHMDRPELDANKRGFVAEFTTRIREHCAQNGKQNFFIFGEAFDGNDELTGAYTMGGTDERGQFGRLDSAFYFSQKYRVFDDVFKNGGPTRNIECMFKSRMGTAGSDPWCTQNGFPAGPTYFSQPHATPEQGGIGIAPQQAMVNFFDNHDLPRFLFENDDVKMLQNALLFLLTWDGIPAIYYGTEQLFEGGVDPRNREDMFGGNIIRGYSGFDTSHEQFAFVRDLIAIRKQHTALRRGTVSVTWSTDRPRGDSDSGIFAFERVHSDGNVLVIVNTADGQESTTCAPPAQGGACMVVSYPAGTVLEDVAPNSDGATFTVAVDQSVNVSVPPRGGRILIVR